MLLSITVPDTTYWGGVGQAYAALGPPLVPSNADIDCMESAVAGWAARHPGRRPQALMLGVTARIAEMGWPEGAALLAADNSMPMMQAVWPGNVPRRRAALLADWRALPLRPASRDIVIGDGSLSCVRYPHAFRAVAAEVRRVLRRDGILVMRCYVQAAKQERKEEVLADLVRGAIPSFHWFKFRLLMAMQESAGQGAAVDEVYRYWASQNIDEAALIGRTGWDAAGIRMIELYRGRDTVHTFLTMAELRSELEEFFEDLTISEPPHAFGDRCPILMARPRGIPRRRGKTSRVAACAV